MRERPGYRLEYYLDRSRYKGWTPAQWFGYDLGEALSTLAYYLKHFGHCQWRLTLDGEPCE